MLSLAGSDQDGISKAGVEAWPLLADLGEAEDRRRLAGLQPTWADKSKGHAGTGRVVVSGYASGKVGSLPD